MPNESSVYAREGNAAHDVAELGLKEGKDAIHYVGQVMPDYPEITVDDAMCTAVQEYLDAVRGEIKSYTDQGHDDHELGVEIGFDLSHIYPEMYGTCDAVLYLPAWKKLIVFDYKHGWVSVPVERNKQTMYYALGAVTGPKYHNRLIEKIELVIVQPRSGRHTIVKRWECDREELEDFKYVLIDSAKRTENPRAPLVPGEWCKFCNAAPVCRALANRIGELIMAKNDPIDGLVMPDPDKIGMEEAREIWANAPMIESWIKNFKSYYHNLAVRENKLLPRTKLVEGRTWRAWKDKDIAAKELESLKAIGEIESVYTEPELKSPAQIEDQLPKKLHGLLSNLIVKGRGALTLVPDTDERASAKPDAFDEF
jgi:hypothetical protein